jgi:hypothetical protein
MFSQRVLLRAILTTLVSLPAAIGLLTLPTVAIALEASVASEVSGVAVETSRDLNGDAKAPVTYDYNGVEFTELIDGEYIAGESVSFSVTSEGEYVPLFTPEALFLSTFFLGFIGAATSIILWLIVSPWNFNERIKKEVEAAFYASNR